MGRQVPSGEAGRTVENTAEETSGRLRCSDEDRTGRGEIRIGDFEPPEEVPETAHRKGCAAAHLYTLYLLDCDAGDFRNDDVVYDGAAASAS